MNLGYEAREKIARRKSTCKVTGQAKPSKKKKTFCEKGGMRRNGQEDYPEIRI